DVEPEMGYGGILKVSEAEAAMRESRIRRTKTVCTYCGVGCSFDVWTKDRHMLKDAPEHGPANGISTCIKGNFGWDFVNSPDRMTSPVILEEADRVLIVGSHTAESHPVLATRVKSSQKLRGQKLIVADIREHEMARRADLFFSPRPGMDLVWLSAISRYLLDQGLAKTEFL